MLTEAEEIFSLCRVVVQNGAHSILLACRHSFIGRD